MITRAKLSSEKGRLGKNIHQIGNRQTWQHSQATRMPRRAPAKTWDGVWPRSSFSFRWLSGCPWNNTFTIRFRTYIYIERIDFTNSSNITTWLNHSWIESNSIVPASECKCLRIYHTAHSICVLEKQILEMQTEKHADSTDPHLLAFEYNKRKQKTCKAFVECCIFSTLNEHIPIQFLDSIPSYIPFYIFRIEWQYICNYAFKRN